MQTAPLVIFILDAAVPQWLREWANEGSLPHIKKIIDKGIVGHTVGKEMVSEHGIWAQFFTGVSKEKLGYYFFRQPVGNSYDIRSIEAYELGVSPFWEQCRAENKRVAIIDLPDPMPVPDLPGIQVHNWGIQNMFEPLQVLPAKELGKVKKLAGSSMRVNEIIRSTIEQDHRMFDQLRKRLTKKEALIRGLLKEPFDLVLAGFGELHTGGHQFWKYRPGGLQEGKDPVLRDALKTLYKETDAAIGRIIAELPVDSNIMIISSVGFMDQYPNNGLIEEFCFKLGYQTRPKGKNIVSGVMGLIRTLLPASFRKTLRTLLLSRKKREKIFNAQWKHGIDWSKTKAYALPSIYKSFIKVNLQGREPMGIVSPDEYDRVLDDVTEDLLQLRDEATGLPMVSSITRSKGVFTPGIPDAFPDLFVSWRPCDHFVTRVNHPLGILEQSEPEFFRDSEHDEMGFFAAAGPSFNHSSSIMELSVLDFVPTFLELLKMKPKKEFIGKSFLTPHKIAATV